MASFVLACACVSGCAAVCTALPAALRSASHVRRQVVTAVRVDGGQQERSAPIRYVDAALRMVLRNGFAGLLPVSKALLAIPVVDRALAQAVRSVRWHGFATERDRLLSAVLALAGVAGAAVGCAAGSLAMGALASILLLWAASFHASRLDAKRD